MNAPLPESVRRALTEVSLDDKWTLERGRAYMSGTQALIRLLMLQRQRDVLAGLEPPIRRLSVVLLPAFFVLIGLRTDIASAGSAFGGMMLVILACAVGGKLGGSAIAARTTGLGWPDSLVIGALLDTRGLVELVALDIGRGLNILSPPLFTMLVVMTFATTFATAPLVRWLRPTAGDASSDGGDRKWTARID